MNFEYQLCTHLNHRRIFFASYESLVNHLASANYKRFIITPGFRTITGNSILESCTTPGDSAEDAAVRRFTVLDKYGLNAYCKKLIQDVARHKYDAEMDDRDMETSKLIKESLIKEAKEAFDSRRYQCKFREGSVTNIGSKRYARLIRKYQTAKTVRSSKSSNIDQYADGYSIPSVRKGAIPDNPMYDDCDFRSNPFPRSWKDSTHNRKQWQRGVKNSLKSRGKGQFVMTPKEFYELLEPSYPTAMEILETVDPLWIA